MLEEQDRVKATKLEMLRKKLQKGVDELGRGEGVPLDVEAIKEEGQRQKSAKKKQRCKGVVNGTCHCAECSS
jgi:hypothetical protein